ncbi:NUDIX domain-containing protein [Rhodobacteraceae bacterium NNCM2]|nr:NUDIX domain-containing protein [Coraliihabitans acroporae]
MTDRRPIRVAARALIVIDGRLLLVNAYRDPARSLWCAPGGGGEPGEEITETLRREVFEETGLAIRPGPIAGVSEFHDPEGDFHQIDLFFHAATDGRPGRDWVDPEGIVSRFTLAAPEELAMLEHKPDHLGPMAFDGIPLTYHGIELKV